MNAVVPIHFPAVFALLLLASMMIQASAAPPGACTDELVAFSPCLSYVSSPPNNVSSSVSPECCSVFSSSVFDSRGNATSCLCYLLRQPLLLGFPLNTTRLLSLSSLCPLNNATSLESLCLGSPSLPPLQSTTGSTNSPPPLMGLPSEPAESSSIPSSSIEPATRSSATELNSSSSSWFLPGIMIFLVPSFAYL